MDLRHGQNFGSTFRGKASLKSLSNIFLNDIFWAATIFCDLSSRQLWVWKFELKMSNCPKLCANFCFSFASRQSFWTRWSRTSGRARPRGSRRWGRRCRKPLPEWCRTDWARRGRRSRPARRSGSGRWRGCRRRTRSWTRGVGAASEGRKLAHGWTSARLKEQTLNRFFVQLFNLLLAWLRVS